MTYLAHNPEAGDLMPGTGGARKVRFAGRGKGKSGGYRVVTFYGGEDIPVFLLDVYGKDTQANLSQAERNALRKAADGPAEGVAGRDGEAGEEARSVMSEAQEPDSGRRQGRRWPSPRANSIRPLMSSTCPMNS